MTETRILLDPTAERTPAQKEQLPRPASLDGLTVGLLDISKPRGNIFLNRLETPLVERGLNAVALVEQGAVQRTEIAHDVGERAPERIRRDAGAGGELALDERV